MFFTAAGEQQLLALVAAWQHHSVMNTEQTLLGTDQFKLPCLTHGFPVL